MIASDLQVIDGERLSVVEPQVLTPLDLHDLLAMTIKPRAMLLAPLIPEKGLAMLYGPRGMGKTHLALSIAYAVASGGATLRWAAPRAGNVLYLDGEMPLVALQERLAGIVAGAAEEAAPGSFRLLPADHFDEGLPNLATEKGQAKLEPLLAGVSLLVVDNISTLASIGRDNDAESWGPVQGWLLQLRRRGLSALLVHHAGKGGQQRGTSRREDVLDTVIALRRPDDYSPTQGARFEVHLEKARGIYGDEAKPFEAQLESRHGAMTWSTRDLADADLARVAALVDDGLTVREIAEETGKSKSAVQRLKDRAAAGGHLNGRGDHDGH